MACTARRRSSHGEEVTAGRKKRNGGKSYPITGLDRPLGLQEVEAPRISRQSALEGGKVVSPTHRPSLPPPPPRKDSWYSFLLEATTFN
jgi:hypothetical protein